VYCRISSDRDDERLGVERQEADCRDLCAKRGWDVIEPAYVDNDISAADPRKVRPEYGRLLADIEAGRVDAVVVWAEDRLHRRPIELETFVAACERAGMTRLASVGGEVDLNNDGALLTLRVKAAVAAQEVASLRRRVERKHRQIAEAGQFHGGMRPFGYEADGVTVREHEAAAVREAADRVLSGQSLHSIAEDWNRRGVKTVRDRKWAGTTVKQMLLAPRLCGVRSHHGEVRDAVWPAILPRETWEDVKALLTAPGRAWPTRTRSHPLRKILVCGECGRELYNGSSAHTRLYQCRSLRGGGCGRTFVKADRVEAYVFEVLIPLLDSPTMRDAVRAEDVVTQEEVRRLVAENAEDQTRLAELADMVADGDMDRPSYARASRRLRGRIDERSARLSTVRGESVLDRLGGQVAERWPTMTDEEKRTVLGAIVENVIVAKGKGGGPFDPRRVRINFRTEEFARAAAGLGYAGLAQMVVPDSMTDEVREAAMIESGGPMFDEEGREYDVEMRPA